MLRIGRFFVVVAIIILVGIQLLPLCQRVQATEEQLSLFDYLEVDINILNNSDIEITETHKYSFMAGTFHYGYRWIPLEAINSIEAIQVSEDGQPYTQDPDVRRWIESYQTTDESPPENCYAYHYWIKGDKLWIGWWYPETKGGSRTFELTYTVHGGLHYHEDGDQLYWVAIFGNRDKAIDRTKVTVHLPEPVSSSQLIIDSYGAVAQSNMVNDRTIEFTTGPVLGDAELSIRIIFPHGIVNAIPYEMPPPPGISAWFSEKFSTFGIINLCLGGLGTAIVLGVTVWLVVIRPRRTVIRNGPGYRD